MIVINIKSYQKTAGKNAEDIAKACKELSSEFNIPIILAPSAYDISLCSKHTDVYAQHIDACEADRNTGFLPLKLARLAGAKGSLLNHSEHRITEKEIEKAIIMAKKENMRIILCAKDHKEAGRLAAYSPYAIAVEPPELIAGNISVSTAKPEVISRSVEEVRKINPRIKLLVGAGIKNSNDVRKSLEMGAKGILIASGIVFAKNQREAILDMIRGFQKE
jgi:triosephosphate isomerase (TIM)